MEGATPIFLLIITVVALSGSDALLGGVNLNIPEYIYMDGPQCNSLTSESVDHGSVYSHLLYNELLRTSTTKYSPGNCTVTLDVGQGNRARLYTISTVQLQPTCEWDRLTIYDGSDDTGTRLGGLCGTENGDATSDLETTGRFVTLKFETSPSTPGDQGFRLYFNSFSDTVGGTCATDQFQCDTDRCIPQSHTCDGFRDCADNADEEADCAEVLVSFITKILNLGVAIIAGIAIGIIVVCILCCIGCYCCCCRKKRPQAQPVVMQMQHPQTYA